MPPDTTRGKALGRIFMILFSAFLLLSLPGFSQFRLSRNCLDAYRSVLSLKFSDARLEIGADRKIDPANLIPVYLEDYMDFLSVFTSQEQKAFEAYDRMHEKRLSLVEAADARSPYYGYCLGNMHLMHAVARMQFGEKRGAAIEVSAAYRCYHECQEKYPSFLPVKAGAGFIHILAGLASDSYGWLLDLVGIRGTVEEGTIELTTVANYDGGDELSDISASEAIFFLALSNSFLTPDKSRMEMVIRKFDERKHRFPEAIGPLVVFAKSTIFIKSGMNEDALDVLGKYSPARNTIPFHYLDFLYGKALLNHLDPSSSLHFTRFLKNYKGTNYLRSAWQKLGWSYLIAGDTVKYLDCMSRVKTRGNSLIDTDVQALKEAQSGEIPNIYLLRARLLSDGGYYDQAMDILLGSSVNKMIRSKKELVEYNYRLGRICQQEGKNEKALHYFDEAIRLGRDMPFYFAANAALQSGLITENEKNYKAAAGYFSLCLSIDSPEYKTSLSQKAKAGLKRTKKYID